MRMTPYAAETTVDDYFKMPLSKSDITKARAILDEKRNWFAASLIFMAATWVAYFALPFLEQMLFLFVFFIVIMLFTFLKYLACSVVVMIDGTNQVKMFGKFDLFPVDQGRVFLPNSHPGVTRFLENIKAQDRPILQFEMKLIDQAVWK